MFKLIDNAGNYAIARLTGKPFEYSSRENARIGQALIEVRDKCAYRIQESK